MLNRFFSNSFSGRLTCLFILTLTCFLASFCLAVLFAIPLKSELIVATLISQAVITIGTFLTPVWCLKKLYANANADVHADSACFLDNFCGVSWKCVVLAIVALLSALPFLNWLGTYTEMIFPADVVQQEQMYSLLTDGGIGLLAFRFVVVAFLAAFCEEIFFRGTLQRLLTENVNRETDASFVDQNSRPDNNQPENALLNNPLLGVFLTALIFSLIHFDMSGFFQRLILGLYLGLAFYWTKSLWTSFAMHLANNGLLVFAFYYLPVPEQFGCELDFVGVGNPILAFGCLFVSLLCMYVLFKVAKS